MRRAAVWIATGFGIGNLPLAPATGASLAVAILLVPLVGRLDLWNVGAALVFVTAVGIWAAGEAERSLGTDAKPIVIDEVAGMLAGIWGVPLRERPVLGLLLAFLLFRFFDIVKPPPIRQTQKLPGGWGVVVDDLLAGVATNIALRLALGWLSP
jgi:phosphatidylglycerophosphatase A